MNIDADGNMELSAEENQSLMDELSIEPNEYDDPPVEIEYLGMEEGAARFNARHTRTGKSVILLFDVVSN